MFSLYNENRLRDNTHVILSSNNNNKNNNDGSSSKVSWKQKQTYTHFSEFFFFLKILDENKMKLFYDIYYTQTLPLISLKYD